MCNKKYIEFSANNAVEVISMSGIKEGYDKKDRKAEEYETKLYDNAVKYLVQFPGLTIQNMIDLNSSKAASFNTTGKTPFTCLIDPRTETEIKNWSGGSISANALMDAIVEWRKTSVKEHGKGFQKKNWHILTDALDESKYWSQKENYAKARSVLDKIKSKVLKWPDDIKIKFDTIYNNIPSK